MTLQEELRDQQWKAEKKAEERRQDKIAEKRVATWLAKGGKKANKY